MRTATEPGLMAPCPVLPGAYRRRMPLLALLALLLSGAQAQDDPIAVGSSQGRVLVSDGVQFVPLRRGHALQENDRVLLLPGAKVEIRRGVDCTLSLQGPGLFVVPANGACAAHAGMAAVQALPVASAATFDGAALLARTGGLGRIEAEPILDTVGP